MPGHYCDRAHTTYKCNMYHLCILHLYVSTYTAYFPGGRDGKEGKGEGARRKKSARGLEGARRKENGRVAGGGGSGERKEGIKRKDITKTFFKF